ncbi:hypothetical protein [Roseimicrobium gellanilyticum]|uniref:hypothetical protein n=1 Tax=Roseimicrobium gellanilyticum TaxID=748857 RepID=UPI0011BDA76E|nr:hypothetical protein [Roseimicrobium gellanilyticum]
MALFLGTAPVQAAEPLLLVTPSMQGESYLVAPGGEVRHTWPSKFIPSGPGRIDKTGALLRVERDERIPRSFMAPGATGGRITKIGWDGGEQWSFSVSTPKNLVHHDALQLPNGNILALVWERHEPDVAQGKGRDANKVGKAGLWSECLWELQPQGKSGAQIVWEWKAWNHARRFPEAPLPKSLRHFEPGERININDGRTPAPAWAGVSRMEYHARRDQILLVASGMGGVWVLDHSTTKAEAATDDGGKGGKGGRLLYQWDGSTPELKAKGRKTFVVDAEWVRDDEGKGKPPVLEVLRGVQGDDDRIAYAVERWELPWSDATGYTMVDSGEYAPPLLKQATAVPARDSSDLLERPTALTHSPHGASALTFGYAGLTRWPAVAAADGSPTVKAREHRNEAGKTTLRMSIPTHNALVCCGGESPSTTKSDGKKAVAPLKTLTSAPVLKSRLVLETAFTPPHESPKAKADQSPQAAPGSTTATATTVSAP